MSGSPAPFSPEPALPQNPEFYRRVLHNLPAPVLVVNAEGTIIYGNLAVARIGGWLLTEQIGTNVLDYIDPSQVDAIAEAFFELVDANQSDHWAPINTLMRTRDGQTVPLMVTGAGFLHDPEVEGIIYDIRPALEQDILRRGLAGLTHGEPIDTILELITDMVSLPPLGLDAAVLEPLGDGSYRVIGATDDRLAEILAAAKDPQPWNLSADSPLRTLVSQYPGGVGEDLFAAGYREFWHVCPEVNNEHDRYRIVACGRAIQNPAVGQVDRLSQANELASVVLLRARADALLEHSATHDALTELPNRAGFQRQAQEVLEASEASTAALLFVDLDGFKEVNDAHGHAAGDHVLETVAQRLVSVTRSIDLVARLGGDEFVILIGATTDRPASRGRVGVVADRALVEVQRAIEIGEHQVRISASIGAAIAPMPADLEEMLLQADSAMYEAKRNGGNRYHVIELGKPNHVPDVLAD